MVKIIVVEDEYRIRTGLGNLIEKVNADCKVIAEAENGYEGLKLIQSLEPDIVITDISMPKFDGLQMIEKAKELGLQCKFVILSGYANFEYAQKGIRLGVKEYLLKPVTITNVRELLSKLVESKTEVKEHTEESENGFSKVVSDMIHKIDTDYGKHLGLDYFVDKYRLTPEYISILFTKETGVTFSNYLKKVRIEKAKELLRNTNIKIYEVACRVGYPDQKYFSKVFKEYTGVSAKQFVLNESGKIKN
ncbi:response regulator transcription factor [Anaerocolumna sp. MB42-C2]|uniref:response regulator transcription factor n=1 Tax=Anaerocolumna sp. MB42-C2 TaxID=3070997 RepID=UPI0027E0AD37|nr:response regulator [Anaerocolumna sp. MB42-C2]WMJ90261.1 response regulator [Anaerocolumna sp. MB42-C2]